jgi:hypothetical protein
MANACPNVFLKTIYLEAGKEYNIWVFWWKNEYAILHKRFI